MNNSFTKAYTPSDKVETEAHFQHPILNSNTGRTNEQIKAESEFQANRPTINKKTGGRK